MKVKQIRDPNAIPLDGRVADTKIALVGAGSASLSCAAFLGRLGYKNVHIFEK
jgi:dihydropyrimidine dehydrogenase (NADP+)